MTPQQIDQKVTEYLVRAMRIVGELSKLTTDQRHPQVANEVAKLIQEEEHHQEQMELIERLEKN